MGIEVGSVYDGKVTKLAAFGAFVALEDGKSGLVHISQISSSFIRNIGDVLSEGQTVRVKVIGIDERGRLNLSIKEAAEAGRGRAVSAPQRGQIITDPPEEYTARAAQGDSFEEMMTRFKAASNDKMSDLKQSYAAKRGAPGRPRRRSDG